MKNYSEEIEKYVVNLIKSRDKGNKLCYELSVDDLFIEELSELANLFIEYNDRDNMYDCFQRGDKDSYNDDITCALLKLLKDNSPENKENLSDLIIKRSVEIYKKDMQETIDEQCSRRFSEQMREWGYKPYKDHVNGETLWRQSA